MIRSRSHSQPSASWKSPKSPTRRPGGKATPDRATKLASSADERRQNRVGRAANRRQAIFDAALDEFIDRGYAATRLDDIARRAGVAKGTIYLYFKDKQALFEELVRSALLPLIDRLAMPQAGGGSARALLENFVGNFVKEVVATRRSAIVRLILAEGPRFPDIADFYYREVVARGLAGMRALIELGIASGEIRQAGLKDFPQLVVAPAIVAVIWQGLFARHAPLDVTAMLRVHLDLIFGERRAA
jgi:AcrR family transcriptional regulator